MRISDANVGDVMLDQDECMWAVRDGYVVCILEDGQIVTHGAKRWLSDDAEQFGPFVRLVPEKEGE